MEEKKKEIQAQLDLLKEMINLGKPAEQIEKQRIILDDLLKEYVKDL